MTSLTTMSTYSSKRRSLRWTSSKRQIMGVIEVEHLEETYSEGHWGWTSSKELHNVGTVPTLYILNVGSVPILCILNVGTVPTFSPSEQVHLNDLHYLSLEAGPPQWPPLWWMGRPCRQRGPKIVNFCRTEGCRTKKWGRISPGFYWYHQK